MEADVGWAAIQVALLLFLPLALWYLVWRPRAIASSLAGQGVRGPPYHFLAGSMPEAKRLVAGRRGVPPLHVASHDIIPLLLPQFHRWVTEYAHFPKDFMIPVLKKLLGNGVIVINGDDWKRHRKVVLPAFNHDKLKSMSVVTAEVTGHMIEQWRDQIKQTDVQAAEIDVIPAFCNLTEEIIGRVTFGMNGSQPEAKVVVRAMREMQKLGTAATIQAPILWV
ncbi:hypothetical protein ACP4OV_012537 [Aristida adscensionis]